MSMLGLGILGGGGRRGKYRPGYSLDNDDDYHDDDGNIMLESLQLYVSVNITKKTSASENNF